VHRLFNSIDDNALINQSLAQLEKGHEVDTVAKPNVLWTYLQMNMAEKAFLYGVELKNSRTNIIKSY
jgi:hypothetical protein